VQDRSLRLRLTNPAGAWGRAGLHTGDRLVSLDGRAVESATDFHSWFDALRVGQTASVGVMRNGATTIVIVRVTGYDRPTVRLEEIPDATPAQQQLRERWLSSTL